MIKYVVLTVVLKYNGKVCLIHAKPFSSQFAFDPVKYFPMGDGKELDFFFLKSPFLNVIEGFGEVLILKDDFIEFLGDGHFYAQSPG
ncbi:MAG: hypothetical protein A4E62_01491 [Syntrophorhabdus sp. PtaU1.Bin002]|nr:MAG: hypothetical protein A4E62_01491 [Syntrophorhabdus sp. PtaU1.Bin002]